MSASPTCPVCGAPLAHDAPRGLCPRCLLAPRPAPAPPDPSPTIRDSRLTAHASRTLRYFGDYELLEEIARGGMGVVYKARQVSLNRIVAVKMILSGRLASAADMQRFRQEAEAAASLQHPNIVAIHEVGEHEGQHYFSMDFVEGRDLTALVREGPLPARRAAAFVQTIAEAIHYAHQKGVLHRDLKPSNILIDQSDKPRVTDFGLAKRLTGSNLETSNSELTLSGQVLGTPAYMAPEQASGKSKDVGPPGDVYSLGAILYELLAGRAPFVAETPMEILMQVVSVEPVSPRLLNATVPRDLETIALKCLEKEAGRRYQSAQELADELGRFQRDEPICVRPVSAPEKLWRWCRRKPVLAGLGTLAAMLVVAGFLGWPTIRQRLNHHMSRRSDDMRARAQAEARSDRLRAMEIPVRDPACSPNAIDLTDYYNAGLTKRWHGSTSDNTLAELPRGWQEFAGVAFDVRGLIQLASEGKKFQEYPREVSRIRVRRPARRLHFLHAVSERPRERNDEQVGSYIVQFANRRRREILLVYGRDLRDWWTAKGETLEATQAVIAWQGHNPYTRRQGGGLRLFKSTWDSPFPGTEVESIDFVASMTGAAPFLIAITVE